MAVKRREVVRYFEENGFYLTKRHRAIDNITENELCKRAGLTPKF